MRNQADTKVHAFRVLLSEGIWCLQIHQRQEAERQIPGPGEGDVEFVLYGDRTSVWEDEEVLKVDSGDHCTIMQTY